MGRLPDEFNMSELFAKTEEKTPYTVVALQECERMNMLLKEIRRSLKELDSGLKVRNSHINININTSVSNIIKT